MDLNSCKYVYLIGIGGIGMSALARYFNSKGLCVYGYDKNKSEISVDLEGEGMKIHYILSKQQIPKVIQNALPEEILVVYTPAISKENLEYRFFYEKGCVLYKRAEILGMISENKFTIAIAGTHGKTTTSTILAHILNHAGIKSTAFLGGISKNYNSNLLLSENDNLLIVEADEYDRSFLYLKPDIAIITSLDSDHMDIYQTKENMKDAYIQFCSGIKEKGILLVEESINIDFNFLENISKFTYSSNNEADFYANNIYISEEKMKFNLVFRENKLSDVCVKSKDISFILPGIHNVSNVVAASAISFCLGLELDNIVKGIESFKGVNRRFDILINTNKLVFIDDYAHHPEEVKATIKATKNFFPNRDITVVFQPHLYSRTKNHADDFALSLSLANQLILMEVYPARETPIPGVSSEMLLSLCSNINKEICSYKDLPGLLKQKEIDVLLTLGAGDISNLVAPIKQILN